MAQRVDDMNKLRPSAKEADLADELRIRSRRIADRRARRIVLAKIDALLSARAPKTD